MEYLIRGKRGLKYFWLTTMPVIFEMKIFVVRNKKYLHRFHTPYSMRVSPHKMIDQSICYKKNKSLFFWRHKTWPNVSFKCLSFSKSNRFIFSREIRNIRSCKEVGLQKLIKFRLSGWYLFLTFFKLKNLWRIYWGEFVFPIFGEIF